MSEKIVLITGASSGIGEKLVQRFVKEGWKLVLTYCNNGLGINRVIKRVGKSVLCVEKLDLSSSKSIDGFVKRILGKTKELDLLINNAGIGSDIVQYKDCNFKDLSSLVNTNLVGVMYLTKLINDNYWEERKEVSRIINTSSIRGIEYGGGNSIIYSTTKAGLNSFAKTLAKLWAPNILVNAVAPGFTYVKRYDKFSKEVKASFLAQTYLKKYVVMDDLLDVYVLLSKTTSITGQIIYVDCGFTLK